MSSIALPETLLGPLTVSGRPSQSVARADGSAPSTLVDSQTLLGKQGELRILHNNRVYRLRVTMNGKLILTA